MFADERPNVVRQYECCIVQLFRNNQLFCGLCSLYQTATEPFAAKGLVLKW